MRYRWLGLTTLLSRLGTPLTVLASVLIFGAVAGIILLTAGLLVPVVRTSFVALLSIVFALPYAVKVAQVVRALHVDVDGEVFERLPHERRELFDAVPL